MVLFFSVASAGITGVSFYNLLFFVNFGINPQYQCQREAQSISPRAVEKWKFASKSSFPYLACTVVPTKVPGEDLLMSLSSSHSSFLGPKRGG